MLCIFYTLKNTHTLLFGVQRGSVRKAAGSVSKDTACQPFAKSNAVYPHSGWSGWDPGLC